MKLTKRQKILGTIGLVIIFLVTGTKIYFRHENIQVALAFGHLAKLPENSRNVKVETAGGFFSRTFWLTFESSQNEIDQWIKDSKELHRKDWENTGRTFKVLDEKTGEWRVPDLESVRQSGQPDWFDPEKLGEVNYTRSQSVTKRFTAEFGLTKKWNSVHTDKLQLTHHSMCIIALFVPFFKLCFN